MTDLSRAELEERKRHHDRCCDADEHIKALGGYVPMCAFCRQNPCLDKRLADTALHLYDANERLQAERDDYKDAAQADRDAIGEYVLANERLRGALEAEARLCCARLGHDCCEACERVATVPCITFRALQGGAE